MTLYDLHCNACNAVFEAWQDRNAQRPFPLPEMRQEAGLPHDPRAAGLPRPLQPAAPASRPWEGHREEEMIDPLADVQCHLEEIAGRLP